MNHSKSENRFAKGASRFVPLVGFVAAVFTLQDPGLTVDEPINVGHGKNMVTRLARQPSQVFHAETVYSVWRSGHEHPPLARFLLGLAHATLDSQPEKASVFSPRNGRLASALAYAGVLALVVGAAGQLAGASAGAYAGLAALAFPRLFAHGRLASPEVISAFFVFAASFGFARWLADEQPGGRPWRQFTQLFGTSALLSAALLTKLTAVLVPVAGLLVAGIFAGRRGLAKWLAWSVLGGAGFLLGWPWLWPFDFPGYSPGLIGAGERLAEFLAIGVNRATLYVWYFGRQYPHATSPVPFTFVLVFFVGTVPLGLVGAGGLGLCVAWRPTRSRPIAGMILAMVAVPLAFFMAPLAKYDGERLFLFVFPFWAVFCGLGIEWVRQGIRRVAPNWLAVGVTASLLAPGLVALVRLQPCQLSYYNEWVGGLAGADRLGLEATYWGDSLTHEFLDRFAQHADAGAVAGLLPTLYPGHPVFLETQATRRKNLTIIPGDQIEPQNARWAILFHRAGYLHDPLPTKILQTWDLIEEFSLDGVWLTRLYRQPRETSP